ncbi:Small glutamine-rich tetratricopeptide repeat-containing protein beta [Mucuna pruriens]|uniref:Small glutamine-rich tetratricopeptide repeat-containing protein beta n=1 Tax=Mucuna pruriens TaxID=157652 RepID=A0A371IA07_MUCPR|nr:Small glutamine-rich tetratricopeptide repeat-containing protein beta [Mucuna pruriens]
MDNVLLSSHVMSSQRCRFDCRAKAQQVQEIRVCTNRICRRQGSLQTLETLSGVAPPNVAVKSCGCLGRCGGGPNLVVLPDGFIVGHCGTAARAAEVMVTLFAGGYDPKSCLDALALRKRADVEFANRNFTEAELLLSQAIDLKPFGGIHVTFKCRSFVRLELGNYSGALEDAEEALALAPGYSEAYVCQGDAFLALNKFDLAEQSYLASLDIDPSIRRSKSFKARILKLQEKLAAANTLRSGL